MSDKPEPAPKDDMWRADVAGFAVSVRGETAKAHLENVSRKLARMKAALRRIAKFSDEVAAVSEARRALGDD